MRSVNCPYCRFAIELKGAKPGRFHPACPGCREHFLLLVSEDPREEPEALVMPPEEHVKRTSHHKHSHGSHSAKPVEAAAKRFDNQTTVPAASPKAAPAAPAASSPDMQETQAASAKIAPVMAGPVPYHGGRLGGYELLGKLGQGGMGAVYLARQKSLNRNVALKVLAPRLAAVPQFVSRFTREAFAAAQLSHHNVVQIHDIGVEHSDGSDTNYFVMEFVKGRTLAGVVKETGQVDPQAAVGYVLQAARGLKFAHDHGLIHRDVKPDNLLLNEEGIVKVADLGLVKRMDSDEREKSPALESSGGILPASQTDAGSAMGTPAYMSPEQAQNAAGVDARADIYALGCTLYDLLTGRPPFIGETAAEVITQHANKPVVPPDRVSRHVPTSLSQIVMRMLAKQPEQRYANMAEVIAALEGWLGIEPGKPFTPRPEHIQTLEFAAERFHGSNWNAIRKITIRVFFPLVLAAIIVLALPRVNHPLIALGLLGFGICTFLIYQLVFGIANRGALLRKVRQLVFSSSALDWLIYLIVAGLVVLVLMAFDLQWVWLGFAVGAAIVAGAFYLAVDVPLARDRQTPIVQTERMLKELRSRGLDENTLRQFVCKYGGRYWEEFYEQLFGYEAKLLARRYWGSADRTLPRPQHAAWREPIIAWIDRKVQARQEDRQQRLLARLEARALRSKGFDEKEATNQGRQNAERLMEKAAAVRHTAQVHLSQTATAATRAAPGRPAAAKPEAAIPTDWVHDDSTARVGAASGWKRESYLRRRYGSPFSIFTGSLARFVLGALVLIGFGMWWSNNGAAAVAKQAVDMAGSRQEATLTAARKDVIRAIEIQREYEIANPIRQPLRIKHLPDVLCDAIGSWNAAVAGGLLLLSIFFVGRAMAIGVVFSAIVALFAHRLPIPVLSEREFASMVVAILIWAIAIVFLRQTVDA